MRHRRRGSILVGALAVIFMLLVVVTAMHYQQSMTRQAAMAAEADLRFREGLRFAEAEQVGSGITPPSNLVISGSVTDATGADLPKIVAQYAKNIFNRDTGLPDLRALGDAPLHSYLRVKPFTTDLALMVFGKRLYSVVLSQADVLAAYAPNGSVTIGDLRGWSNPTFDDTRKSTEAFSGVPAKVYARKDATADFVTYGELHVSEGTAKIKNGPGVAYKAKEPIVRAYLPDLIGQISTARSQLITAAASGDKTGSLVSTSVGPEAVLDLFFGGSTGLEQFLSLRNANHFWLPMIPGFCPYPPYVYEFYFSVPFPPDNAEYDSTTAETIGTDIENLQKQLPPAQDAEKKAGEKLKTAQDTYNNDPTAAHLQALQDAQAEYNARLAELNNIQAQIDSKAAQLKTIVDAGAASGMKGVPLTRAQDPSGTDGQNGWNYSVAGKLLGSLISFLTFDAKAIADDIANDDVKLVHFGGKDREFHFILDEGKMVLDGTLSVPRGRSLTLRSAGSITIRGDLWLQRGSVLYAECSKLVLESPPGNAGSGSFWAPSGRVFLEEGASLVCSGDIDVPGSLKWGSVVVGGIPGKIHPITTAIIGQNVRLTNGVFSGSAIDDLVGELGKSVPALATLNNELLRPLLTQIAPNGSKALGPFTARRPYFAKYASTFQVIFPPTPFFGVPGPPIPTPIPLPRKNILNPVARALAYLYSTTLNLSLGENFMTHSDWWIFGEGVVPMMPQVDIKGLAGDFVSFPSTALGAIEPAAIIQAFAESVIKTLVSYVVKEVIQKLVTEVAMKVIPYGGIVGLLAGLLPGITDSLTSKEDAATSAGNSVVGGLTDGVKSAASQTLDKLQTAINMDDVDVYMREYNGLLVYGENITVGGRSACGMFVANQNLDVTATRCVGTLASLNGNITAACLMFYPHFNRASLYLPKDTPDSWFERAMEFKYDSAFDSGNAVDVGPPAVPRRITAEGWSK